MRTWKVIRLGEAFEPNSTISLICPTCGEDAQMPCRELPDNPVIASVGLAMIFDRPGRVPGFQLLPDLIQCRRCKHKYERE